MADATEQLPLLMRKVKEGSASYEDKLLFVQLVRGLLEEAQEILTNAK